MRNAFCIAAVVLVLCSDSCNGLAVRVLNCDHAIKRGIDSRTVSNSTGCGFAGNSDIYGIGIRVGYYTQTLSVWFANYFVLAEAKLLRSINVLFLFAVFIGLIWMSSRPSQTYAIEAYIVLTLLITTWHVGVLDNSRFRKMLFNSTAMTSLVRLITMCSVSGYFFWFWWFGLDEMEETPCGTYVWAIVKTDLYGWVRILNRTVSACFLVTVLWMHMDDIIGVVRYLGSPHDTGPKFFRNLRESLQDTGHTHKNDMQDGKDEMPRDSVTIPLPPDWYELYHQDSQLERETNHSYLKTAIHLALPLSPQVSAVDYNPEVQDLEPVTARSESAAELPSMTELVDADRFLQCVLDFDIEDHSIHHFGLFKDTRWAFNITYYSPQHYWKKLASIYAHRPLRLNILAPLFSHLIHLEKWKPFFLPAVIEIAVKAPDHKTVTPLAFHTILAFHTVKIPIEKRAPKVLLTASWSLLMFIVLILSIELSLVWNNIYGMGNFGAVGQLIPATLGSGGLVKVVWVWWSRRGVVPEEREGYEVGHDLRECVALFDELKKQSNDIVQVR